MPRKRIPKRKGGQLAEVARRLRKDKAAMAGLIAIVALSVMALLAGFIADYDSQAVQMTAQRFLSPSAQHWFGTDNFGRDIFARVVHGARLSLSIGLATTVISLFVGFLLGAVAAFYGGLVDSIIIRVMDMLACIPAMLLALAIVAALGPSMTNLLIAITVANIPGFVRLIKSTILGIVDQEFIEAAKACGTTDARIIWRHILPNAMGPIIVTATGNISSMIIAASGLSFLGFGAQPPTPEWGAMLSDARQYMRTSPHLMLFPGSFIILAALSFNLMGDGLRDALDPRLKD